MYIEETLSIIKPDAVSKNVIGCIYSRLEQAELKIIAAKMKRLSDHEVRKLYAIHVGRPFYDNLIEFMSSGPVMIQVIQGKDAVSRHRKLVGATNPKEAAPGTIRADFASSIDTNAIHCSDSKSTACFEISLFFKRDEIYPRS